MKKFHEDTSKIPFIKKIIVFYVFRSIYLLFFRLHALNLKPQDFILQVYKPQESSDQSSVMGWVHCLLMNPFEPCHAKTELMHTKCKVVKNCQHWYPDRSQGCGVYTADTLRGRFRKNDTLQHIQNTEKGYNTQTKAQ